MPDDLVIRPLEAGETELFLSYSHAPVPLVGTEGGGRSYAEFVDTGQYRPEWSWVAVRGGAVVARAAWWGPPGADVPGALDWLDPGTGPDRVEVGAALLTAAQHRLGTHEYHLFLPPAWREVPAAAQAAADRLAVAERGGLTPFVERLNYRWTTGCPVPERSTRVEFRPADDGEVLAVLKRILAGTLDAYSRRDVARLGLDKAADEQLAELHWYPSPRDWWRLGYDHAGDVVGVVIPGRNHQMPVVGYVGVVPEQRGHGYAEDLLAEATLRLAGEPDGVIGADTDVGNTPMAATFARAGYPVMRTRIVLSAPDISAPEPG